MEFAVWFVRRFLAGSMGHAAYAFDTKITFWGVIHHELSHAIAGILTGAKIIKFDSYKLQEENKTLGSVRFRVSANPMLRAIQLFFISIAPLIGAYITCSLLFKLLLADYPLIETIGTWRFWLYLIIATPIIYHADLSPQDMLNALSGLWFLVLLVLIISILNPTFIANLTFLSSNVRNISLLLLVPPFLLGIILNFFRV